MADTNDGRSTTMSRDDEQVFQWLAEAQQQYEQYLAITHSQVILVPIEPPVVPPSPDLPLTLAFWRD